MRPSPVARIIPGMANKKSHANYDALTTKHLRALGYRLHKLEHFNVFGGQRGIRQDMWGFGDYLAVLRNPPTLLAVQSTSHKQKSPHLKKICTTCREAALDWLAVGRIVLLTWRKSPANRWVPDWLEITPAMIEERSARGQPVSSVEVHDFLA